MHAKHALVEGMVRRDGAETEHGAANRDVGLLNQS